MKNLITMTEVTADQVINSTAAQYNPTEWKNIVTRYNSKNEGTVFYKDADEDRYYAVYKIAEGLIIFNELTYHSCIHNGGFTRMLIVHGKFMLPGALADLNKDERFETLTATNAVAYKCGFGESREQRVTNTKAGRAFLIKNICAHGVAVTND